MKATFKMSGVRLRYLSCLLFLLTNGLFMKAIAQPDCAPINASSCQNNVTEDFNQDNGGFSSDNFTWNLAGGNWQALIQNRAVDFFNTPYTITSGVYTVTQEDFVNYGFTYVGAYRIDITIIDANTNQPIVTCGAVATTEGGARGERMTCLTFTNTGLDVGDEIIFVTTFYPLQRDFRYGKYIVYDNFSVAGSAIPATMNNLQLKKETNLKRYNYKSFVLYPNPVFSTTTLTFDKLPSQGTLTVRRADGLVVWTSKVREGANSSVLDLSKERPGLYMVTIQLEGGKKIAKKLFKYN